MYWFLLAAALAQAPTPAEDAATDPAEPEDLAEPTAPVVVEPVEEPATVEPVEDPATVEPAADSATVEPTEEPVEPAEEPAAVEPAEEPAALAPAEEPVEPPHRAPAISVGVGIAQSTQLPVAGLDLSWMASPERPSLHGNIAAAWGMAWRYVELPSGRSRLSGLAAAGPLVVRHAIGGTVIAPLKQQAMDLRLGVEVGGELVIGGDGAPIGSASVGYVPRALAIGEFVRNGKSESAVGMRAGVGSLPQLTCDGNVEDCLVWRPGFVGGIYLYYWAGRKVHIEAEIGRTSWLTVGYRF